MRHVFQSGLPMALKMQLSQGPECAGEHPYDVSCPRCYRWLEVLYDPRAKPRKETRGAPRPRRPTEHHPVAIICLFCDKTLLSTELHLHRQTCSAVDPKRRRREHPKYWLCYYCRSLVPNVCSQRRHRKECPRGFSPPDHSL